MDENQKIITAKLATIADELVVMERAHGDHQDHATIIRVDHMFLTIASDGSIVGCLAPAENVPSMVAKSVALASMLMEYQVVMTLDEIKGTVESVHRAPGA